MQYRLQAKMGCRSTAEPRSIAANQPNPSFEVGAGSGFVGPAPAVLRELTQCAHHSSSLALVLMGYGSGWPQSELRHIDVFTSGQDGYHTFRIPAIEAAPDGSLLAFAEARKYNRSDPGMEENDIDLVMKRSTDGGATWSAMKVIEDPGEKWSAANPATVVDKTNRKVWLFYIRSKPGRSSVTSRPGTDDMQNMARTSTDNGVTWSEPIDLTSVARDLSDSNWRVSVPGPGGPIQDRKGRLIVAFWKVEPPGVFALFSEDHGRTWRRGQMVPGGHGGDENQLVELSGGRILMDFRQNSGPRRWMAVSNDGGKTWSEPWEAVTVTPVACAIERFMPGPPVATPPAFCGPARKGPGVSILSSGSAATRPRPSRSSSRSTRVIPPIRTLPSCATEPQASSGNAASSKHTSSFPSPA